MSSSERNNQRSGRGCATRAKNTYANLNKPLHPDLDGVGIDVDIPDLVDRFENGNRFKMGLDLNGPQPYSDNKRVGVSLFNLTANANENIGCIYDIGRVQAAVDGVGIRYNAHGATVNTALGPLDLGAKFGTAEAGAKVWEPGVGLDTGFKANASLLEVNVGPVNGNIGMGFDTGLKVGKEGVGLEVLGTGVHIGRVTKVSLFGSSFSFKWF